MWTTGPMERQAMALIRAYGYMYKTNLFVWVKLGEDGKPQKGKGHYTAPCCEFLLIATKGQFRKFFRGGESEVSQLLEAKNLKKS